LVPTAIHTMEYIANKIGLIFQVKTYHIVFHKITKLAIKILDLFAIIHLMITTALSITTRIIVKL